jgi:hypothetical protein
VHLSIHLAFDLSSPQARAQLMKQFAKHSVPPFRTPTTLGDAPTCIILRASVLRMSRSSVPCKRSGFGLARIFLQISWRNDISSLVDGQGRLLITQILSSLPQWGSRIESKPITLRANLELAH